MMSKEEAWRIVSGLDRRIIINQGYGVYSGPPIAPDPVETQKEVPLEKVPPQGVVWDDICGLEEAKRDLREAVELPYKEKDLYLFYNKRPIKGVLLSGSPGCGKTMLGKALATSLAEIHGASSVGSGFVYIKGPEVLDKFVGGSDEKMRGIFSRAKDHKKEFGYPSILFFDEADALLRKRSESTVKINVVPTFLAEMDGMEESAAIVILATNCPEVLDPAVVREGRIDRKIHIEKPKKAMALKIVLKHLSKIPLMEEAHDLALLLVTMLFDDQRKLNSKTKLASVISGAMLVGCVDLAVSNAIHRDITNKLRSGVSSEDIVVAVERIHRQNKGLQLK